MPRLASMTTARARACGIRLASASTDGCSIPARAAAARIQPITRADAAMRASPASVSPSIATARSTDAGVNRRTLFRGVAAISAYRTGVATDDRGGPEVIVADLDW